ncbi:hypothetical protein [Paenibacillus sp. GYB003]|uniref:hypothetical protein n=1 Tax=Paenibacillus sp. GYB003 TaxID=2994392 RepID=UPI002F968438
MKKNTLWSKLVYLTERKVIQKLVDDAKPSGSLHIKYRYALTELGLTIILHSLEIPVWTKGKARLYYSINDLKVRAQKKHHFMIVDWISRVQQKLKEAGIFVPDSEWRRYYSGDPNNSETSYKPDWILYEPNVGNKTIIENQRYELHPFVYPLSVRDQHLNGLYEKIGDGRTWDWRSFFKPMMVLEMDTGSMKHKELVVKYQSIIETLAREKESFPKMLVFANYLGRLSSKIDKTNGDNEIKTILPNSMKRLRNTRRNIVDVMRTVLINDDLSVLHCDEYETILTAADFVINGQQLVGHLEMSNFETFQNLLNVHNSKEGRNARVFDPRSEAGKEWRDFTTYGPGIPDFYVIQDEKRGSGSRSRFDELDLKELDFIYLARKGWVNPLAKAEQYAKWLSKGGAWGNVSKARIILLYPNRDEFMEDVFPIDFYSHNVYFVSFEDFQQTKSWGPVFKRHTTEKKGTRWIELHNGESVIEGEGSDHVDHEQSV